MATAQTNLSHFNLEALPEASLFKVAIVVSEWNEEITENLYKGAYNTLVTAGLKPENLFRTNVPGSFELVFGAKKALEKKVDAVIVIGSVIQGETKHFDFVCQGVTQGIVQLNITYAKPVIFCVLTDNTLEQAKDRSGGRYGNKGVEAAVAALKMIRLFKA